MNSDKLNERDKEKLDELYFKESVWNRKSTEEKEAGFKEECDKYSTALKILSELLKKHHNKNVIILIDEYDVPLENSYFKGFYPEMVGFIRSLFESALKTNDALERAVVTGCLRISRESVFTGLNNLEVNSIRSRDFGEYFGFTVDETETMLKAYDLSGNLDIVRQKAGRKNLF